MAERISKRGRGGKRRIRQADPPIHGQHPDSVSASDLARFGGICQLQVYLDQRHPEGRDLVGVDRERERGLREHERHHVVQPVGMRLGHPAERREIVSHRDKRCYVATAVYGSDAWQTERLRAFRDRRMLSVWWGRVLVWIYYRAGPLLVRLLPAGGRRARLVRRLLDGLVERITV